MTIWDREVPGSLYIETRYKPLEISGKGDTLLEVELLTGRSHQIRVQFSSRGHALFGDQRYNKEVIPHTQIALWSYSLSFMHPTLKNEMTFRSLPFDHPSFKDFKEVLQCLNKEELSADNSSSY